MNSPVFVPLSLAVIIPFLMYGDNLAKNPGAVILLGLVALGMLYFLIGNILVALFPKHK